MTSDNRLPLSRGRFLQLSSRLLVGMAGILGLVGLARFFSHTPKSGGQRIYDLGPVEDFPASGRLVRPDIPAVVYRMGASFQAYSLICTHLGCTLEESGDGFACPCHGSQFDRDGRVTHGPASQRLEGLQIELSPAGHLLLQGKGHS